MTYSVNYNRKIRIMCMMLVFVLCMMFFGGPAAFASEENGSLSGEIKESAKSDVHSYIKESGGGIYGSLNELKGKRIGIQTGTYFDTLATKTIGEVELIYFTTLTDLTVALKTGKIDSFIAVEPSIRDIIKEEDELTYIPEYLEKMQVGIVFLKNDDGQALKQEFDEFILKIKNNGTLHQMNDIWFSDDESVKVAEDYRVLPETKGRLRVASDVSYPPFEYIKDSQAEGFDIDLVSRFCKEYGYGFEIVNLDYDGVLSAVESGKCDLAASAVAITEERKESVYFSEPYYESEIVAVVLRQEAAEENSFFSVIMSGFEKTFIREKRYELFVQGIVTTIIITVSAIIFGTLFGFIAYMICRKGGTVPNRIVGFFEWLIQGMPVVVLLMILYYVIFAKTYLDGSVVAVIAFTLVFGAAVNGMLKMGVGAVDIGQTEAAYALGFSDSGTFFRIILPQAIPHFLSSYKAEVISLIKATAVVGYIAVQDLTKMGDIVRSRTYEAFFPLIAVAIIYFILGGILTSIVSRIEINIDPKKRREKDILKGIKRND